MRTAGLILAAAAVILTVAAMIEGVKATEQHRVDLVGVTRPGD